MGDQNLRVWPVQGDGYGDPIEYPRYAKYRKEPHYPGAAGDVNHDLVIYRRGPETKNEEEELGRHKLSEVIVAHAGQPTPVPVASDPTLQGSAARNPAPKKAGTSTAGAKK